MSETPTPTVKDREGFGRSKIETTLYLQDAPITKGEDFVFWPTKAVVVAYPDANKMSVQLSGRTNNSYPRTTRYNLKGYDKYRVCPEWLLDLLREVGVTWHENV